MIATIDKAGRLVIPKPLRDAMGLTPGVQLRIDMIDGQIVIDHEPIEATVRMLDDGFPVFELPPGVEPPILTDEMLRERLEAVRDEGVSGRV